MEGVRSAKWKIDTGRLLPWRSGSCWSSFSWNSNLVVILNLGTRSTLTLVCFFSHATYDAVSDLVHNWVAQRPDFKSAVRVVKMVLNTQCYQYLWLTIWFHAKKSKETLKNQNGWFYNVNSARDLLNFLYRYGIFWMPPGESSHPGGSEYVWQRGVEGILGRVTGSWSLPYFLKCIFQNLRNWALTWK